MNRSRLTEEFEVGSFGSGGELAVLSGFVHPVRGPVVCPAARLVAGWLGRRGVACRVVEGGSLPAGRGGRLHATTYLDLDGSVTGIAVVAPTAPASLAAAEAVRVWSATLRTRRVIVCAAEPDCGNGAGFPAQRPERFRGSAQCAGAAATAATVRQYLERGDTVLALGAEGGWEGCVPVVDVSGARALQVGDPERLSFVQRPCAPVEEVAGILAVLRARFPMLRGQHPDQWCYRSSDRGRGIRAVVESSDLVLASEGDLPGPRSVTFGGLESLTPELLAPVATLGVIAPLRVGAAGGDATDAVIDVVGGLGPLSVVHHRSVTSVRSDVHARASRGS